MTQRKGKRGKETRKGGGNNKVVYATMNVSKERTMKISPFSLVRESKGKGVVNNSRWK